MNSFWEMLCPCPKDRRPEGGVGSAFQKHFLCTIPGPLSSYSSFLTHMLWKVERDERIEPPIHTDYLRSGGATTLIFIELGARLVTSLDRRSAIPSYIVVPPESTMFAYRSLRTSMSHFMMLAYTVSWMPVASRPMNAGLNRASGQRNRSEPTVMT